MKLTLGQINTVVGDVPGNVAKIKDAIDAAEEGSLLILPEMVITGYPLEDLVFSRDLQAESLAALDAVQTHLASTATDTRVILGFLNPNPLGKPFNASALISRTGVEGIGSKMALPTYGVFDENRLFTVGEEILTGTHGGERFAVIICEDAWIEDGEALRQAAEAKPDVLIIINGSPFEDVKRNRRLEVVEKAAKLTGAATAVYLNLVGGQDDLVFDGGSFVFTSQVGRTHQAPFFEEAVESLNTAALNDDLGGYAGVSREEVLYRAATLGLRDYVEKNGFKTVLVGVSGGIDSALVAALAADALGGHRVYGVSMPSQYSSQGSLDDAKALMENLGGHYSISSIAPLFATFQENLPLEGLAEENLQARLRGVTLMGISNRDNALVLTPGNKSELSVGYSTLYGDTVGGYAPLKDLYKTDVYALARWRNSQGVIIPISSIEKEPSAELKPGQVDQDSLPPYDVLDAFLRAMIEARASRPELEAEFGVEGTADILWKIKRAEWKRRQYPIGPKLTSLGFGRERYVPITVRTLR